VQVFGRRDDETDHALKRPATKKSAKARSRGQLALAGSKRYGDCMSGLLSMLARPQHRTMGISADVMFAGTINTIAELLELNRQFELARIATAFAV